MSESPFGTVHTQPTIARVTYFGAAAVDTRTPKMTIDGVAYRTFTSTTTTSGHWVSSETLVNGVWTIQWTWVADTVNANQAALSCYPPGNLGDGVHHMTATLKDVHGVVQSDSWDFTIGIAPTFGAPTPTPGSTVSTQTPTIQVPVTDNGTISSSSATVNGVAAPTSLVGGVISVTSPILPNDATTTVFVTATDSAGNASTKSWGFWVEAYSDMASTVTSCTECHHDDVNHSGMVPGLTWSDCQHCHITYPHPGTPTSLHARATVTSCSPCHVSDITVEHARHGLACVTCHQSTNPAVVSAIQNGDSNCSACHGSVGHEAAHDTTYNGACTASGCHATNLATEHVTNQSLTCDTCHSSSNPTVTGAISAGDKHCTTCHGPVNHTPVHTTTNNVSCTGLGCHNANLITEHVTNRSLTCQTCHSSSNSTVTAAISSGDTRCTTCHGPIDHTPLHVTTANGACAGTGCHNANLATEHVTNQSLTCQTCHASSNSTVTGAISAGDNHCTTCHGPIDHTALHATTANGSCTGSGCHDANLVTEHVTNRSLTCATCHASGNSTVTAAISASDSRCTTCHGPIDHTTLHATTANGSCTGTGCHDANLATEHVTNHSLTCQTCHASSDSTVTGAISSSDSRCTTCHGPIDHTVLHVTTNNGACTGTGCHDTNLATEHIGNHSLTCGTCHASSDSTVTGAIAIGDTHCTTCHGPVDHTTLHATTTNGSCTGTGCHNANLVTEHVTNQALTCQTCHASSNSTVTAAISGGDTRCTTCHGPIDHTALHATTANAACTGSGCHNANLATEHVTNQSLTCATCHASSNSTVTGAISGGDSRCTTCHGPIDHTPVHATTANSSCTGTGCHNTNLVTEHVTNQSLTCQTCHASSDSTVTAAISGGDTRCTTCHGPIDHTPVHATTNNASCTGSGCHSPSLTTEHITNQSLTCATCHASSDSTVTGAISSGDTHCTTCHGSVDHTSLHATTNNPTCTLSGCHNANLATEHVTNQSLTCQTCHASSNSTVTGAISAGNTSCLTCHSTQQTSHYNSVDHTATPAPQDIKIEGTDFGTHACSECHSLKLGDNHKASDGTPDCAKCHPNPRSTFGTWNFGCVQGGCHSASSSAPMHGNIDSAHTIGAQTCTTDGCHPGALNIAAIHSTATTTTAGVTLTSCQICHAAGRNPTTNCTASGCHPNMNGHGDVTALHTASITNGSMSLFDEDSWHYQFETNTGDINVNCTMCHSANLVATHGSDCSLCHFGSSPVRKTFTTWDKSCTQGGCHADGFHGPASGGHDNYVGDNESGSCDCHNYVDYTSDVQQATSDWCGSCHTLGLDTTPPTSSSDAVPSYVGTASINFSASDDRSVKWTKYRLDGGATATVSAAITVAPPASGSVSHTLVYWSSDWSGNVEAPQSALFVVSPDTTAPVTSSDATATYAGPVTIQLTATDNGTDFGVAGTFFRVDSGATQSGTTISIPQPSSGTTTHTVDFWSVDYAGNVETAKHRTFSDTADLVAPTVTSNLLPLPHYYGINYTYVYLYPSDPSPSSGIARVHVTTNDHYGAGGYWTVYGDEAVNQGNGTWEITTGWYEGTHSLTYYAVDNAGNVGPSVTSTFTCDGTAPVTTNDIHSPYNGTAVIHLTATDSMSGVASTNWYVAGQGWNVGNTITLPAPGSGSTTYYLWYYSVDNVGNNEGYHTNVPVTVNALADTMPPYGTMTVNNGSIATSVTAATVNSSVTDTGTGVAQMRVDPGTGTYGSWISYAPSYAITLPSGDGTKTVNVQYRDSAPTPNVATLTYKIRLDTVAPTGSMSVNNNAAYSSTAAASVNSTVTDAGSGVASMSIDPGTGTYGPWVSYAASSAITMPTGDGTKTVRVRYLDRAGMMLSLSDTIVLDATPPSGTMSVNNNATYALSTAASVNSTVTDALSGLAQMRIDPGSGTYGAWIAYAASSAITLPAGDGTKTVNAQYRDNAGGVTTLSDTIVLDTSPPSTTSDAVSAYAATATVHLSASDAGSGVKATYFKLDGGLQTTGTVVTTSVQGSHTLQFWSVDNIGLKETTHTANFTVTPPDTTPPTTTSNAVSSYIGTATITLSPSDTGGSGLKATYYKVDSGAQTTGTVITVGGVGSHSIEFWSVDNANNTESPHNTANFNITAGQSFAYTGATQTFRVPAGVTSINVDLYGGAGGDLPGYDAYGGNGGYVHAIVPVTPGQVLTIAVGGKAGDWSTYGAWPNGGNGDGDYGAAGGGSTFLATDGGTVLAEAGAGGGAGDGGYNGGDGGWDAAYPVGGDQGGGDGECGGGGGWLGGAGNDNGDYGSADGGASFINSGFGTMIAGVESSDGFAQITYPTAMTTTDVTPPSTTSNAASSYTAPVAISLTATDPGGWGVRSTYYVLDGGSITDGNVVSVLANGSHTLQYWSVDNAGNAESPHTASFTISIPDHTPPTTTSDVSAAYAGTATITLYAVDDVPNGSGVSATHYIVDGGNTSTGTSVVVSASGNHTLEYWSVDVASNIETHHYASFLVDKVAPITSSDVRAAYNATANITLTATDPAPGSGVWYTFYRVDGGTTFSRIPPTVVSVTTTGTHTLEYWTLDNVHNAETHTIATFVIDKNAPVTSSNATSSYTGTATVTLTATDTGGSGLSATFYRVDSGGATQTGTSAVINAPGVGSAGHTLYFWSTDNAGNVEIAKSATFTVNAVPDTTPPTTTSNAAANYNATATITLTPTDSGSGVKATYFKLDGGAQTTGTVVTTGVSGGHTLQFWSVDNANNKETTRSATFVIDKVAPTTTSDAFASYSGTATITLTAADTGGSGVAATYYKLDGGAQTSGTTIVVSPPASDQATHTILFWSVDAATNVETTKSATFVVKPPGAYAPGTQSFGLTYTFEAFTVPSGVTVLNVDLRGAQGGAGWSGGEGMGGRVRTSLSVTPGQVLYMVVGGQGSDVRDRNDGGWPDGGAGDSDGDLGNEGGGGGGGGTEIISHSGVTLAEAGGGGAGGEQGDGDDAGWVSLGSGGGRAAGADADAGSDGGGGGGGWDGGAAGSDYQGGQGGSSYVAGAHIGTPDYSGTNYGDGSIVVTW